MTVNSRTKNTSVTATTGMIRAMLTLISLFVSRTVFIHMLGAEYLSINGLFSNILSILSLAELGIGAAINFYLYKPIAEGDNERIKCLMGFYKQCYKGVGSFIVLAGVCIIPWLPKMVNFDTDIDENLYLIYILYLLTTACSYFLNAYKQSFLQANQMGYIIENINIAFVIIACIADIIILCLTKNFVLYLILELVILIVKNISIGAVADRKFPFLNEKAGKIQSAEFKGIFKDVKNVLLFNIGDKLINSTDNIIISTMIGTIVVGYYSNYFLIITQIKGFYNMVMGAFRAGIGDVIARNDIDKYSLYKQISLINQILTICVVVGLCQVFNDFIRLWIGGVDTNYILSQSVVILLCLSLYYDTSTVAMNLFRESSGNFHAGKYTAVTTGIVNLILSVLFAKRLGLLGVFLATVVSKYTVAAIPFNYEIGEIVFDGRGKQFIFQYYVNLAVMGVIMIGASVLCEVFPMYGLRGFVLKIVLCTIYLSAMIILVYSRKEEFKILKRKFIGIIVNRLKVR